MFSQEACRGYPSILKKVLLGGEGLAVGIMEGRYNWLHARSLPAFFRALLRPSQEAHELIHPFSN